MNARRPDTHRYSDGRGFGDPYEGFDLGRDRLDAEAHGPVADVDPVDDYVLADVLDESAVRPADVEVSSLIDVGVEYVGIEQYEQAVDAFARAAYYAPEDSPLAQEAWVNKGIAHGELGEWDDAAGAHREALRIDADDSLSAAAATNLAGALWELGESTEPLDVAESAVERDPRLAEAWYNRGYFLNERGQYAEALRCLDAAVSLGLRTAWVDAERARAFEGLGEFERVGEIEERAGERLDDRSVRYLRE